MNNRNPRDRARLLVEAACDEYLSEPNTKKNDEVVELCNFFLFGGRNQVDMATTQLRDFFKSANPSKTSDAADFVAQYRFSELVESLGTKYNSVPEGWTEQNAVYAEVSRSIRHILMADSSSTNLKQVTLGLALLDHLAQQCHRAHNRFLLEAVTDDELLRQLRTLWKAHQGKTGRYSMEICERVLGFVQTWRDELVPPSQRKRSDPANKTQWSLASVQASFKSYSSMSTAQLAASAQSAAHWADKRLREATGTARDRGIFGGLDECHHKLKKRGADFPQVVFGSSTGMRGSMDIQRVSCSEEEERGQWEKRAAGEQVQQVQSEKQEFGFGDFDAFDQQPNDSNASSSSRSPSTVTTTTFEDGDGEEEVVKPKGPLKIKIKAAKMSGSGGSTAVPMSLGAFALAPPPGSNRTKKSAAIRTANPPAALSTAVAAPPPAAPTAPAPTMDLLDFGFDDVTTGAATATTATTTTATAGAAMGDPYEENPFADHQYKGNPFGSPAVPCKALVEEDPFAALALRTQNC